MVSTYHFVALIPSMHSVTIDKGVSLPVLTEDHSASASTLTLARDLPPQKGKHSIYNSSV